MTERMTLTEWLSNQDQSALVRRMTTEGEDLVSVATLLEYTGDDVIWGAVEDETFVRDGENYDGWTVLKVF